jgi:hypothetical protein
MGEVKTIRAKSKIGAGLFSDSKVKIRVEFDGGAAVELELLPITQDMLIELRKAGVKFADYADEIEAYEDGAQIFNRIVVDAVYFEPDGTSRPLEGKYKDRLMQLPDVMAGIFECAAEHGAQIVKEDEKNSES